MNENTEQIQLWIVTLNVLITAMDLYEKQSITRQEIVEMLGNFKSMDPEAITEFNLIEEIKSRLK